MGFHIAGMAYFNTWPSFTTLDHLTFPLLANIARRNGRGFKLILLL